MGRRYAGCQSDQPSPVCLLARHRFLECSLPVVEHYEGSGKAVRISAVPPPDEVFLEVDRALSRVPCHQESAEKEALAA